MDETSWYKQYSAVELFNANPNNNTYKAGLTKVLIMDYVKKTYMTTEIKYSYYINRNGVQDFHFILPKSYNPNIKIVILGYANGFYCSKPHFNYKRFSNTTFDLEEMPLNLIDFETFFENPALYIQTDKEI